MNVIEAIKSGKRFKRASQKNKGYWYKQGAGLTFYEDDILADDWEVEAAPVTITREQFDAAWDNALLMIGIKRHRDALAKELGL